MKFAAFFLCLFFPSLQGENLGNLGEIFKIEEEDLTIVEDLP